MRRHGQDWKPSCLIQETVLLYPSTGGRLKARRILTDHDDTAAELASVFGPDNYAPKSWVIHSRTRQPPADKNKHSLTDP